MEFHHRATAASLVLLAAVIIAAPGLAIAAPANPASFSQNRQIWDQGADILALQQFLNSDGFLLAAHSTAKCNGENFGVEENLTRSSVAEYLSGA